MSTAIASPNPLPTLPSAFQKADENGDQLLDAAELGGISDVLDGSEIGEVFVDLFDRNDNKVSQEELGLKLFDVLASLPPVSLDATPAQLVTRALSWFEAIDSSGDGAVTARELAVPLLIGENELQRWSLRWKNEIASQPIEVRRERTLGLASIITNMVDANGDRKVDREEFMRFAGSVVRQPRPADLTVWAQDRLRDVEFNKRPRQRLSDDEASFVQDRVAAEGLAPLGGYVASSTEHWIAYAIGNTVYGKFVVGQVELDPTTHMPRIEEEGMWFKIGILPG